MDKNLSNMFDEFDIMEEPPTRERFDTRAKYVSDHFEHKMEMAGKKLRFAQDIVALFRYFLDPDVQWYRKFIIVSALAYFIFPLDAIPDIAPLLGYLDDFGVIAAVVKFLGHELHPYYP